MNWNDINLEDLSQEADWQDAAQKNKKIQLWNKLSAKANTSVKEMDNAIQAMEKKSKPIVNVLHSYNLDATSNPHISSDFWKTQYPGIASLYEVSKAVRDAISKIATRIQVTADNAKLANADNSELETGRLLEESLVTGIRTLNTLQHAIDLWRKQPVSEAAQEDMSKQLSNFLKPISNVFNTILKLSNSLELNETPLTIQTYAAQVVRQESIFNLIASNTLQAPSVEDNPAQSSAGFTQPAFPGSKAIIPNELLYMIADYTFAGATEDESTEMYSHLRCVSKAFAKMIEGSREVFEIGNQIEDMKRFVKTNIAIFQCVSNDTIALDKIEETVHTALAGCDEVGVDLAEIPSEKRNAVLQAVFKEPRSKVAINASGITPISDLLTTLHQFNDRFPEKLQDLRIDLSGTNLRPEDTQRLQGLPITLLYVANNPDIGDQGFSHIASLNKLTALDASSTAITKEALQGLATGVKGLKALYLNDNYTGGQYAFNSGVGVRMAMLEVERMKSLRVLELRGNWLPVQAASSIGELENLRRLDVSNNPRFFEVYADTFRDVHASDELIKLEKLTHLNVSKSGMDDEEMKYLLKRGNNTYLPNLRYLHASDSQLTEAVLPAIQAHEKLVDVNLRNNPGITETALQKTAATIPGLQALNRRRVHNGVLSPEFTSQSQRSTTRGTSPRRGSR